ncbi:MAG TPA: EscN/YscN/HrcN family type III secretion system ATPase, partial [Thermodesulfobacteriota bacterium]|nr:EscN/YscN/HrcN family type III secretion system ATPase [Thermodesulfobacteriota bacterium]
MMSSPEPIWPQLHQMVQRAETIRRYGRVSQVIGLVIEGIGPVVPIGDMCLINIESKGVTVAAETVGFRDHK